MPRENRVFLTAKWRALVMLNYEVDPALLEEYVPAGTVLDSFDGRTYVSLVAFQFRHTKHLGTLAVPFHANFDEVNLRFYVRRSRERGPKRCSLYSRNCSQVGHRKDRSTCVWRELRLPSDEAPSQHEWRDQGSRV